MAGSCLSESYCSGTQQMVSENNALIRLRKDNKRGWGYSRVFCSTSHICKVSGIMARRIQNSDRGWQSSHIKRDWVCTRDRQFLFDKSRPFWQNKKTIFVTQRNTIKMSLNSDVIFQALFLVQNLVVPFSDSFIKKYFLWLTLTRF